MYTKRGTLSLKKESSANVAVIPDTFIEFNSEDIAVDYGYTPSSPIAGNRSKMMGIIANKIPAPVGKINLNVEPKTIGHFLNGLYGVTSGVYFKVANVTNFAVGDTINNGSTGTGTIVAIDSKRLVILATGVSGDWTTADTVSNGGTGSALLATFDDSVYGHYGSLPAELSNTYTVQINYEDNAIRYMGCYFRGIDALTSEDNVITSGNGLIAQSALRHAKVKAIVTAGAGAKSIPIDQTQGFVTGDSIKVFRPSTGAFLDFSAASVKTHTIGTVDSVNLELDITNLETQLEVGDLVMLAPQTATFDTEDEFKWVGGATTYLGADLDNLSAEVFEEFTMVIDHEFEERHGANGNEFADRFPSVLLQKGVMVNGTFKMYYSNEEFISYLRANSVRAMRYSTVACQIGTTGIYYTLEIDLPEIQFGPFDPNLTNDDIANQEIPYEAIYDSTDGALATFLLINDVATY